MNNRSWLKVLSIVAAFILSITTNSNAQRWNPFDKDSEVREGLRKIDPGPAIGDGWHNDTTFHGGGQVVKAKGWTTLRNLGKSDYFGWSLDIDKKSGGVILNKESGKKASGTYWQIRRDGKHNGYDAYTIKNLGKSKYYDHYLDIDGKKGTLMLHPKRLRGANWLVRSIGEYRGYKAYVIQNLAEGPYRGWYLDIDRKNGTLALSERPFSGIYWWLQNPPLE